MNNVNSSNKHYINKNINNNNYNNNYYIELEALELAVEIGIHPHEHHRKQTILVDATLEVRHLHPNHENENENEDKDDINQAVDYDQWVDAIRALAMRRFNLQETLAVAILDASFFSNRIVSASVYVRKTTIYPDCRSIGIRLHRTLNQ